MVAIIQRSNRRSEGEKWREDKRKKEEEEEEAEERRRRREEAEKVSK
tara:strand:+ start:91 stop:231 length:141 start_codon:yes stop_codon:yes gene_type:complete